MERYSLLRRIGRGRFGDVYVGVDTSTGEKVAVKVLDGIMGEEEREIHISARCSRRIVTMRDMFEHEFDEHVVFDLMYCDLSDVIYRHHDASRGRIGPSATKYIMKSVLEALNDLHSLGIVHCDIKPRNVLLSETGWLRICDLGTTHFKTTIDSESASDYFMSGTRSYVAPEVLLGSSKFPFKRDIWAVGCIFAELITGNIAFKPENPTDLAQLISIIERIGKPEPSILADIPEYRLLTLEEEDTVQHNHKYSFEGATFEESKLLSELLDPHPANRPKVSELLMNEYFVDGSKADFEAIIPSESELEARRSQLGGVFTENGFEEGY